jgi:hypothetical protein
MGVKQKLGIKRRKNRPRRLFSMKNISPFSPG